MASCSLLNNKSNAPWKSPDLSKKIAVTLSSPAVFVAWKDVIENKKIKNVLHNNKAYSHWSC